MYSVSMVIDLRYLCDVLDKVIYQGVIYIVLCRGSDGFNLAHFFL
jgi:hypothetical protein